MLMLRKSAEILKCTNTANAEMCTDARGAGRAKVQQVRSKVQRAQQISETKSTNKSIYPSTPHTQVRRAKCVALFLSKPSIYTQ